MKRIVWSLVVLLLASAGVWAQDAVVDDSAQAETQAPAQTQVPAQPPAPQAAGPVCYGESKTSFDSRNVNRTANLKLAVSKINGVVLAPGQVFSYNRQLGRRTAEAGYKEAIIFSGGKQVRDLGGGICQVSSTLFSAALLSGMEILSRRSHSQKVAYIPAGMDAMVYYGSQDFSFRNNLRCPVTIRARISGSSLTVSLWGDGAYKRKCTVISQATRDGLKAVVKRIVETDKGKVTDYTSGSSYGSSSQTKYTVVKTFDNKWQAPAAAAPSAAAPPAAPAAESPEPPGSVEGDGNEDLAFL